MIILMGKSLIQTAEKIRLKINEEKIEFVMVSQNNGNQVQEEVIEMEEYGFKKVDQFKYLGLIITQDNYIKTKIFMKLRSKYKLFYGLGKFF